MKEKEWEKEGRERRKKRQKQFIFLLLGGEKSDNCREKGNERRKGG